MTSTNSNPPVGADRLKTKARVLMAVAAVATVLASGFVATSATTPAFAGYTQIAIGDVLVSNVNLGSVNEYSPSNTLVRTVATGLNQPAGMAFDGAGDLFVTEFGAAKIDRIDHATGVLTVFSNNTILADGTAYNSPESIAFAPGFKKMYVSDARRDSTAGGIHVVDAVTGKGLGFYPVPASTGPDGAGQSDWLALNAAGELYMTNENPAQGAMKVDMTTGNAVLPSFTGAFPQTGYAISFDKNANLWVGDTGAILEYSPTGKLLKTITNAAFLTVFAAVFNPAGDKFYAGDVYGETVYTYDLNGTQLGTFNTGDFIGGLAVKGGLIPGTGLLAPPTPTTTTSTISPRVPATSTTVPARRNAPTATTTSTTVRPTTTTIAAPVLLAGAPTVTPPPGLAHTGLDGRLPLALATGLILSALVLLGWRRKVELG